MNAGDKIIFEGVEYEAFKDEEGSNSCRGCELRGRCTSLNAPCDFDSVHFVRPDEALKRRLLGKPVWKPKHPS